MIIISDGILMLSILIILLTFLDIVIFCRIYIHRINCLSQENQKKMVISFLVQGEFMNSSHKSFIKKFKKNRHLFVEQIIEQRQLLQDDATLIPNLIDKIHLCGISKDYIKDLNSYSRAKRIEAAVFLGVVANEEDRIALEKAIVKEKNYSTKLYMANSLSDIGAKESIPVLISTLFNAPKWYREKTNFLLSSFGSKLIEYLPHIQTHEEIELKELLVDFSSIYPSESLKDYLVALVQNKQNVLDRLDRTNEQFMQKACANCIYGLKKLPNKDILCAYKNVVSPTYYCSKFVKIKRKKIEREEYIALIHKAIEVIAAMYPFVLDSEFYLQNDDLFIQKVAIRSLSAHDSNALLTRLLSLLGNEKTDESTILAISTHIKNNPELINRIIDEFVVSNDEIYKRNLATILAYKVEYLILKLISKDEKKFHKIIADLIVMGHNNHMIGFLNKNKNIELENKMILILTETIAVNQDANIEYCTFLNDRLIKKCGFLRCDIVIPKKEHKKEIRTIQVLFSIMILAILLFPAIYIIRYLPILFVKPMINQIKTYVIDFNYYLVFYSVTINFIYFFLLFLSLVGMLKQKRNWNMKQISFLFKKKILPSISIIAPAYNEESTIIDSANSLLNLKYPDYELIIINDGSKDTTLDTLISYFELERIDYVYVPEINTMPVRGVYQNPSYPKLTVVDTENGGKADSLNTGINISRKEYFCGIDADSLLESDALLKLASLTINDDLETPAMGGNILPINGCSVDTGVVSTIRIPKNKVARFQTIEYIRAFMAGRIGWAQLKSLLIISGAFGLFKRSRILEIGGYLTSSGRFKRDTVGEDMELVVRLSKQLTKDKRKFSVKYAFNANCWTEVPESYVNLKKQRNRWHRGLIEILMFHRNAIYNPKYGRTGLIAFPYFFIFEMVGPLIEIQGYAMVVLAAILGLLNPQIALLLFITTIFMGTTISLFSLYIAEKQLGYFSIKELFILVLYAIFENFGPRQIVSLWRVGGYLQSFKRSKGWEKFERKGFVKTETLPQELTP